MTLLGPVAARADAPVVTPPVVVEWEQGARLTATSLLDDTVEVTVEGRARLGPLRYRWQSEPTLLSPRETALLSVDVPVEAFLHDEATRYVTLLKLVATVRRGDGRVVTSEELPLRYAWWPDGSQGEVVVMDHAEVAAVMPGGTTVPRAEAVGGPVVAFTLVQPPILPPDDTVDHRATDTPVEAESRPPDDEVPTDVGATDAPAPEVVP